MLLSKEIGMKLKINKGVLWCMIDSGWNDGMAVPKDIAAVLPLAGPPVRWSGSTQTFGGTIAIWEAKLNGSALLGHHELAKPIIRIYPGSPLIGSGTLRHFAVTIDQQAMIARFARLADGPIRSARQLPSPDQP